MSITLRVLVGLLVAKDVAPERLGRGVATSRHVTPCDASATSHSGPTPLHRPATHRQEIARQPHECVAIHQQRGNLG